MSPIILPCLLLFLAAGCGHPWTSGEAPPVPMEAVGQLGKALTVELINNQRNTTHKLFWDGGGPTFYANSNDWNELFIKY